MLGIDKERVEKQSQLLFFYQYIVQISMNDSNSSYGIIE